MVEQQDVKLTFTDKTHQKYVYMWNNSHRKPTGNGQISYIKKLQERSPCNQVGQGRKKASRWDIKMPLVGMCKGERVYPGRPGKHPCLLGQAEGSQGPRLDRNVRMLAR